MFEFHLPAGRNARILYIGTRLLGVGLVASVLIASTGRNDLDIYLSASRDMLHGENMYLKKYCEWYSFFYSPFFALLVSPLLLVGAFWAKLIWGILSLVLMMRCYMIILERHLPASLTALQRSAIVFFSLLFLFQSIRDNINSSQVTIMVLWLCLEGLERIRSEQVLLGALLIAVGIDMKLIPLVLLPYLIYRHLWKASLLTVLCVIVLQGLPAIVLGWQHHIDLLNTRWALIDPSDPRHVLDEEEPSFIPLGALLSSYLSTEGGGPYTMDLPRSVVALSIQRIGILLLIARAVFVLIALFFLRWPPFRPAASAQHVWWEVSYLLLCTVLIFPHQRYYSVLLAAPACIWITFHTVARASAGISWMKGWLALCTVVYLLTNADLLLGEYAPVYKHYKLMSFMVIALIGMLMWCTPEKPIALSGATLPRVPPARD